MKAQSIEQARKPDVKRARTGRNASEHRAWLMPVSELSTMETVCVEPDASAMDALQLLERLAVDVAPVVDRERRPVGIVSAVDLALGLVDDHRDGDVHDHGDDPEPERLQAPAQGGVWVPLDVGFRLDRPVRPIVAELMTTTAPSLPERSSIALVAGAMRSRDVEHALITDDGGRVVRIVSTYDIVRWLVEHGGSCEFASPPTAVLGAPPPPSNRPFPFRKAQRRSILVVEDDVEICDALASLLSAEGFSALKACDGREALQVLRAVHSQPGLILLDLAMPRMNGWEFRDEQLKDRDLCAIPVVVLTALGTSSVERERMAPAAVLRKPITADDLLETVAQHFQRFN